MDGWRTTFAPRYLKQGEAGGRAAGQQLLSELYTDLGVATETAEAPSTPVWTSIFLSVRALAVGLVKQGTCTADEIEGFIKGLSQSHKALVLVDVANKKDVDDKMRGLVSICSRITGKLKAVFIAYMATFSRLPQVMRVFFAGMHATSLLTCSNA